MTLVEKPHPYIKAIWDPAYEATNGGSGLIEDFSFKPRPFPSTLTTPLKSNKNSDIATMSFRF